jgi:ATP-binding cassette subfamily G (WHITE) protein 2 (PDR)
MLEIVNAGKNDEGRDWFEVWSDSENAKQVQQQIDQLHEEKKHEALDIAGETGGGEYAMPITTQIWECTYRAFQQYWRMPDYIVAKFGLCIIAGLFIGFSFFDADSTQAGLQTVIFSAFMVSCPQSSFLLLYRVPGDDQSMHFPFLISQPGANQNIITNIS